MARASWADGEYVWEVDTDLNKTRITRESDGQQQIRDSTQAELDRANELINAEADGSIQTLRQQLRDAYDNLRAITEDRAVTWPELRDALPPVLAVLRDFLNYGTLDPRTIQYGMILIGETVEATTWAMKDLRDKQQLVQSEAISLRQDLNAHLQGHP